MRRARGALEALGGTQGHDLHSGPSGSNSSFDPSPRVAVSAQWAPHQTEEGQHRLDIQVAEGHQSRRASLRALVQHSPFAKLFHTCPSFGLEHCPYCADEEAEVREGPKASSLVGGENRSESTSL